MAASLGVVTPNQHEQIKSAIFTHLKENEVFSSLKEIISSVIGGDGSGTASEAVIAAARHKSILSRVVADEAGGGTSSSALAAQNPEGRMMMHLMLLGGRAFSRPEAAIEGGGSSDDTVCVCLHFGAQRFRSKPVPYSEEPALRDGILFELPLPDAETSKAIAEADYPSDAMLAQLRGTFRTAPPMHLLVVKKQASDGREVLLSSSMLEWRQVLHQGKATLAVELPGIGAESSYPIGCLELRLELMPLPIPESRMTEADVELGVRREREAQVEVERRFFAYSRSWWTSYIEASPAHAQRPVKLFALSELGTQRPVTAFVQPLQTGRLIESPLQAAHFVALLAHTRDHAAGSSVSDVWHTVHSVLATRSGETEEHALLLCSLLLGFGLDAYVCIGTDGRGPHVWVATFDAEGRATFWESLSGQQYPADGGSGHPYLTLACVFSHAAFYANVQPSTKLSQTSLALSEPTAWKAMDPSFLTTITPLPCAPLQPSTVRDHAAVAAATEAELRTLIDEHRKAFNRSVPGVQWDENLCAPI